MRGFSFFIRFPLRHLRMNFFWLMMDSGVVIAGTVGRMGRSDFSRTRNRFDSGKSGPTEVGPTRRPGPRIGRHPAIHLEPFFFPCPQLNSAQREALVPSFRLGLGLRFGGLGLRFFLLFFFFLVERLDVPDDLDIGVEHGVQDIPRLPFERLVLDRARGTWSGPRSPWVRASAACGHGATRGRVRPGCPSAVRHWPGPA